MVICECTAELASGSHSVKGLVLEVVAENQPVTARLVHSFIQKRHAVSYQGVFKVLNELCRRGILERSGKSFLISRVWIGGLKRFCSVCETRAARELPELNSIEPGDSLSFTCRLPLSSLHQWLLQSVLNHSARGVPIIVSKRAWPYPVDEAGYRVLSTFLKRKGVFLLGASSTRIDDALLEVWRQAGWQTRCSDKLPLDADIVVAGEYLVQLDFSRQALASWASEYSDAEANPDSDFFAARKRTSRLDVDCVVSLSHNPALCSLLRTLLS